MIFLKTKTESVNFISAYCGPSSGSQTFWHQGPVFPLTEVGVGAVIHLLSAAHFLTGHGPLPIWGLGVGDPCHEVPSFTETQALGKGLRPLVACPWGEGCSWG